MRKGKRTNAILNFKRHSLSNYNSINNEEQPLSKNGKQSLAKIHKSSEIQKGGLLSVSIFLLFKARPVKLQEQDIKFNIYEQNIAYYQSMVISEHAN